MIATSAGCIDAFVLVPAPLVDARAVCRWLLARARHATDPDMAEMLEGIADEIASGRFAAARAPCKIDVSSHR